MTGELFDVPGRRQERPGTITITVRGTPAPQGSKRGIAVKRGAAYTGKVAMIESSKDRVRNWRQAVREDAIRAMAGITEPAYLGGRGENWLPFTGPVDVVMIFFRRRPKSHYRTGRNAHLLRDNAPAWPASPPDTSKLVRATEDAITDSGLWADDALVVDERSVKAWAGMTVAIGGELYGLDTPGAIITITGATT